MVLALMNRNLWVVCSQSSSLCVIIFCRKIPTIVLSLAIVKQTLSEASFMTLPFLMKAAGEPSVQNVKVLVRWSGFNVELCFIPTSVSISNCYHLLSVSLLRVTLLLCIPLRGHY